MLEFQKKIVLKKRQERKQISAVTAILFPDLEEKLSGLYTNPQSFPIKGYGFRFGEPAFLTSK